MRSCSYRPRPTVEYVGSLMGKVSMVTVDWVQGLGTTVDKTRGAIALGSAGQVYVGAIGTTPDTSRPSAAIAQYDTSGTVQWQHTLNLPTESSVTHLAVVGDRLYALGTTKIQPESEQTEIWLAQYTLSGQQQWFTKLRSVHPQLPDSFVVDDREFLFIAGHTTPEDEAVESEGWLAKYDPDGDRLWQTSLGQYTHFAPLQLCLGEDPTARTKFARQAVYVAGSTQIPISVPGADENAEEEPIPQTWLARYSSEGIQRWITPLGPSAAIHCTTLTTDAAHQLYVVGQSVQVDAIAPGPWVAHYDAQGQQGVWKALNLGVNQEIVQALPTTSGLQLAGIGKNGEAWTALYSPAGRLGDRVTLPFSESVAQFGGAAMTSDSLFCVGQTQRGEAFQSWVAQITL